MTENRTARRQPARRDRAAAAACLIAALAAVGVVGVPSADAHGGAPGTAHRTAAAATAPALGSAALLQSGDLVRQGLVPVGATVELAGRQGLSACSGEETMRGLTGGGATAYASVTWTAVADGLLTESAASAATGSTARAYEKKLDALVRDCQDEPAGHWYYGAAHTLTVSGGTGHWYTSYSGDGTVSGGVAVLRSGTRVAVVELTGGPTASPSAVKGLATAALTRLSS
ncbi:hypothetical protein ACIQRS_21375 [Streptomyces termitum]|uniref:PknH-like extracellular domain-containing protein n=1 Tax=Streptomyces termitum TaxID=67368 RepID=A0A918WAT0_9ACTN|nr:hypothetical protein [Streptomyces termitum]GHA86840.1 hypothetical protein GCM10010305_33410 [Streptomyces termitum]